jgi:hypothetical protein
MAADGTGAPAGGKLPHVLIWQKTQQENEKQKNR